MSSSRYLGPLRVAMLAVIVAGTFAVLFAHGDGMRNFANVPDFRAFYCAGSALLEARDPYLAEPLRSCEMAATLGAGLQPMKFLAMPAPLPVYSLALFALFARLPFAAAAPLYTFVLVASLCITLVALQKTTGYPVLGILGPLALSDGWVSMGYGQIVPISLMFLCAAGTLLARARPIAAAYCAAGAMIEPHVALPACIALFLFERRTRIPLLCAAAVLAVISLIAAGWATNIEYVTRVLSSHALAEANDIGQFSLTTLLHRLGTAAPLSLVLADLSYAAMVTLGLIVAFKLRARSGASEIIVLVPSAFALFGGPFLHTSQLAVAVPALLVLMRRFPERRTLLSTALLILAIPWLELAENPMAAVLIAAAAATATTSLLLLRTRALAALSIVLVTTAAAACERYVRTTFPPINVDLHAEFARAGSGTLLADATWAIHARSTLSTTWFVAAHAPSWAGLLLMIVAAGALARPSSPPRLHGARPAGS